MLFSSYKVNPKHRAARPTYCASIWTISEWEEVQLFADASRNNWFSKGNNILWAACAGTNGLSRIGIDPSNSLYIAKFLSDNNHEWHGYPVHPRNNDIPPEAILELWRGKEMISKADKNRIIRGKFIK